MPELLEVYMSNFSPNLLQVFKPPNPWTMSIMNVLAELHQEQDLKLNLKFEIEVLCKNLNVDVVVSNVTPWCKLTFTDCEFYHCASACAGSSCGKCHSFSVLINILLSALARCKLHIQVLFWSRLRFTLGTLFRCILSPQKEAMQMYLDDLAWYWCNDRLCCHSDARCHVTQNVLTLICSWIPSICLFLPLDVC